MTLRGFLIIWLLLTRVSTSAQTYVSPMTQDFVPPTPQSWAPVERQLPRPSLLTGAVDLSIPIYTVQVGDYSLPISLQYHSNGVKVLDDPTPLGYGWTLQPALRAMRTILGRPDEHFEFFNNFTVGSDNAAQAFQCMVAPHLPSEYFPERYDSQHDIFTFALPDATITRVLKYDFKTKKSEFVGIRQAEYKVTADEGLKTISVIDPKGIRYEFGGACESQSIQYGIYRTAWALSKITLPSGQDIKLTWSLAKHSGTGINILAGKTYMELFRNPPNPKLDDTADQDAVKNAIFSSTMSVCEYIHLEKISFPGGTVNFKYRDGNISEIAVANTTEVIKTAKLDYVYDTRSTSLPYLLSEVTLSDEGTYRMDYHNPKYWMQAERYSQDWWGFYNGKDNKIDEGLQPLIRITGIALQLTNDVTEGGADRSVNAEAMKTNILTRVTYPTGGYSSFEYEPHVFPPMRDHTADTIIDERDNPYLSLVGGLRIKKMILGAGKGETAVRTTSYTYSNPQVRAVPSAATFITSYIGALPNHACSGSIFETRVIHIGAFSNYMKDDPGMLPLWYKTVTEAESEGFSVYEFAESQSHKNTVWNDFGKRYHQDWLNACGLGPNMVRRSVYKQMPGHTRLCEEETWVYKAVIDSAAVPSRDISRSAVQINHMCEYCPDFRLGNEVKGMYNSVYLVYNPYEIILYSVAPYRDELVSHTKTLHDDSGGAFSTTTEYTYLLNSALPKTVTTYGSKGETILIVIDYASSSRGTVEADMVRRNVVGIPVRESVTVGTARTDYSLEYGRALKGAFVPVRLTTRLASGGTLRSPAFTYNDYGRPTGWTDADGLSETWLWGYMGRYPVWQIPDKRYRLVVSSMNGEAETPNAESLDIRAKFPDATQFKFRPLVGLSEVVSPSGLRASYEYDAAMRLRRILQNGVRLSEFDYQISHTEPNLVTAQT